MADKMKQVAVRFPAKLHKQAKAAAKKERRTFGDFVRRAVEWHIERTRQQERVSMEHVGL